MFSFCKFSFYNVESFRRLIIFLTKISLWGNPIVCLDDRFNFFRLRRIFFGRSRAEGVQKVLAVCGEHHDQVPEAQWDECGEGGQQVELTPLNRFIFSLEQEEPQGQV